MRFFLSLVAATAITGFAHAADWRDMMPDDPDVPPGFVDSLVADGFTNATAFSPTDVLPMSRWAKMAMTLQASVSIVTVALVVARAVNILK